MLAQCTKTKPQTFVGPSGLGISQNFVELDLSSDGSAKVTLTDFIRNNGSVPMTLLNMSFSQSMFGIFVRDLNTRNILNYDVGHTSTVSYYLTVYLDHVLLPTNDSIIQFTYNQASLAYYANFAEQLEQIWTATVILPLATNARLIEKLPIGTQPITISQSPKGSGATEQYVDTDGRWVVYWALSSPVQGLYLQVKYALSNRLWGFAYAPALLEVFALLPAILIVREKACVHAWKSKNREGAYLLCQMTMGLHVALLGIAAASWGLLLAQELFSWSVADYIVAGILVMAIGYFIVDTYTMHKFVESIWITDA
jgi:hypothetical protein